MRYILAFFLFACKYLNAIAQSTYVPDDNFEQFLINNGYDNLLDNYVLTYNLNYSWNGIPITNMNMANLSISDLTGIEDCNNLQVINVNNNNLNQLEIYTEELKEFDGTYTKAISLENYPKAVYFLEINTNQGTVNKKLVLQ